jgi:hypothetical protein
MGSSLVEHFLAGLVYCESLAQSLYVSVQVFALRTSNRILEMQRKVCLFNDFRVVLLWK